MLMIILGAGASYDSTDDYPLANRRPLSSDEAWRPPLATELFNDHLQGRGRILASYPKLGHIISYLRDPIRGKSVEEELERIQEEGKTDPETLRELAAVRYYLSDYMKNVTDRWANQTNRVTNYSPLIREALRLNAQEQPILLVTFNYDELLEIALASFQFRRTNVDDYINSHPVLKVFKLHGSANWSRFVDVQPGTVLSPQELIDRADTIKLTDTFILLNAAFQNAPRDSPIFPAIAVPVQTKSKNTFECPAAHLTYLSQRIESVTKILIIGWQAREDHFLEMLRSNLRSLKHLMVVGQDEADSRQIAARFKAVLPPLTSERYGRGGFTSFIKNREGLDFLASK